MSDTVESKRGKARRSARRAEQPAPAAFSLTTRALSYALAIFLGSTLLFLLEPIAAKRLVPLLGGSAAVWTACLVFFQTALLLGYYVAHLLVTRTDLRTQVTAYVALLALSVVQLTVGVGPTLQANVERPILSVLGLLAGLIGMPFVTLSATSPLLQAWFARTTPRGESDAYGLFAISNIGSIVALLAYPWLIEPRLTLRAQTILVAIVLAVLAILAGVIGASVRKVEDDARPTTAADSAGVPATTRVLWVALAACASLLLAATTTHISQNVVALPLVWIVPLVAYLLSFVVAFSARTWPPRRLVAGLAIVGLLVGGFLLYRGILDLPIVPTTAAFCVALFVLCLFLHSELYQRRPAPRHLTSFYLDVAAGGALGAILVGIVAPLVSPGNYDLAIGLLLTAALGLVVAWSGGGVMRGVWGALLAAGVVLVATQVRSDGEAIVRVRNFYGTVRVTHVHEEGKADVRSLYHGVIVHGRQVFRTDLRRVPNTYYARTSGLGLALDQCCRNRPRRIGVIGLGTGTVAVYGNPGDTIKFYEINRAVEDIALSDFTYLADSPAFMQLVRGDARVSLAAEPPQRYDVLVVDAFSGDAIPAHLLTAQAMAIYRRHLAPGGIIAFHVSNDFLALAPVVAQLAYDAGMQPVRVTSPEDVTRQVLESEWVLVTANAEFLANPAIARARRPIEIPAGLRLWTDDYSSLFPIIQVSRKRN
ncbi:MAG TPA: fused MFS/spermidine synthase [Gemmatimonadaceae bacterium]|nr:fused MFS/spermidine synthase [Gemmatimonadaceae bacterium]